MTGTVNATLVAVFVFSYRYLHKKCKYQVYNFLSLDQLLFKVFFRSVFTVGVDNSRQQKMLQMVEIFYLEIVEPEVVNNHERIFIKAFILFCNYASENLSANCPQHSE